MSHTANSPISAGNRATTCGQEPDVEEREINHNTAARTETASIGGGATPCDAATSSVPTILFEKSNLVALPAAAAGDTSKAMRPWHSGQTPQRASHTGAQKVSNSETDNTHHQHGHPVLAVAEAPASQASATVAAPGAARRSCCHPWAACADAWASASRSSSRSDQTQQSYRIRVPW